MNQLEIVQRAYEAFGRGDVPALLALLHPEVIWENPGPETPRYFGTHRGPEMVGRNVFGFLAEQVKFERFEPYRYFSSDDQVVVLLRMDAKAGPRGQRISGEIVHVFTVHDGKIVRFQDFQNSWALARAFAGC